jgi:uncharacterized membrane protein YjjP (DUF1212 family)
MDMRDRLAGTDDDAGEAADAGEATQSGEAADAGEDTSEPVRVGESDDAGSAPSGPVAAVVDELADTIGRARPLVWREEQPAEAMPLVESLRHTPYREPNQLELTGTDGEASTAMELAVRTGELMLRCGAGARDVESCVIAVAAACGLDNLEVDITNQSLLVQCRTPAGTLMTVLRVVRSSSRDFDRLVTVHQFVEDLASGGIDRDEASERLRRIRQQKRPWPRWFVSLAFGGLAASVAMLLGAGATSILLGLVSALIVDRVGLALGRVGLPAFYVSACGAAIATVFAWVAFVLGHSGWLGVSPQDFAYVVAGGIVVLLPGRAMASSVEDAITGYPVTGAGRLFGVLLAAAGIIVGVAAGLSLALRVDHALDLGLAAPDALSFAGAGASTAVRVAAGALGAAASSVTLRSRRRLVLPAAALGGLGVLCVDLAHEYAGLGSLSALALACVAIGFGGRLGALRLGAPGLVLIVPAVAPLLPGLKIFHGMFELVSGTVVGRGPQAVSAATTGGITTLLGASAAALAIATGGVLGETMASPLDRGIIRQRRARRR